VLVNDFVVERAEAVAGEVRDAGGVARAVPFDVADYEAVAASLETAGPVHILVNNAGNAGTDSFELRRFVETEPGEWDRYFAVNVFGVMNCTRAALPGMIERSGGRVITIVSDAGRWGDTHMAAYAGAKAAAAGFMRAIAREHGRYGITANSVALGSIDTHGQSEKAENDPEVAESIQRRMRGYILRRPGKPEDIAAMVTFLASPLASWITGQTYPVNGGYSLAL
jgi:3-oxoacyl-[acyl-carrier protein] reductase